jgi:hypothetical protein
MALAAVVKQTLTTYTGHVSKFSDVKSSKEKSKPKAKDPAAAFGDGARPSRGGRGGFESSRSRGPRTERGPRSSVRGVGRAGTHATNGTRAPSASAQPAAADSNAWDTAPAADAAASNSWETSAPAEAAGKPAAKAPTQSSKKGAPAEGGPKKTWAQMFAKPPPAPAPQKNVSDAAPAPEAGVTPSETSSGFIEVTHSDAEPEDSIPPRVDDIPISVPPEISDLAEPTITLTPSKDQLTQENVEHLPDTAHPAPVGTAASTVESSRGPDSMTPSVAGQSTAQAPIGRPILGGFATTAYKATGTPTGRSASFQRRLMEQQEAVVMPGNHLVDRTAVQFGSLGLNGDALDVDEDREEAETRAQPPGHSPVAAPRASLPPVSRQPPAPADTSLPLQETASVTKPAPGLPPAPQQPFAQQSPGQLASQASQPGAQGYNQFGRYNQTNTSTESSAPKAYDPFGQQNTQGSPFGAYPGQSEAPGQQSQAQSHLGGFSSAADYAGQYYTADQRNAFNNYYGYNQQTAAQQDAGQSQQRTGSGFGATGEPAFPSSQSQQVSKTPLFPPGLVHSTDSKGNLRPIRRSSNFGRDDEGQPRPVFDGTMQSSDPFTSAGITPDTNPRPQQAQPRYNNENQPSGHTTPNPALNAPQTGAQSQSQQAHLHQQPQGQHAGYPYQGHPYYNNPYYASYMNNYPGPYGQQGYGQPFAGKGGMYNQPQHGYSQYDQHSSSPANAGGFSQSSLHGGRESALTSGLGDYTRSGSAQPSQTQQQTGAGAFGGLNDAFGRSQGAFANQTNQQYGQQQAGQQGANDDALKPFGDSKSGPSPSALGQPGRPGSATNTTGQGAQSGLPPPQSHQQGFGSYPGGHLGQMGQTSQYGGGLGGLGGHTAGAQSHQGAGYGGYGAAGGAGAGAGFSGTYGSYGRGGGWGGNYSGH